MTTETAQAVAEAVAEERQRIKVGLLEEFYEDNPKTKRDHGYNAGIRQAIWVIESGFAAGSVPVATPEEPRAGLVSWDELAEVVAQAAAAAMGIDATGYDALLKLCVAVTGRAFGGYRGDTSRGGFRRQRARWAVRAWRLSAGRLSGVRA